MPKILIVDDDNDSMNLLSFELEDEGHDVITVTNGQECLDQVKGLNPDIILLDLNMPILNGMETLRKLKSELATSSIPVIMLTCDDDKKSIVEAMDIGAHDYVNKPMNYSILSARMRSALRLRESQRQLSVANQNLAKIAYKDPLTDTYNRRYFSSRATSEFNKARRYNRQFSVIMLDVDNFKSLNDMYGHAMGDTALVELAEMCKTHIRTEDFIGRMGGEEFCICCPETHIEGATNLAERMRLSILNHKFIHAENSCSCTVSFGVTELLETDSDFDHVYDRADKLLYQAKEQGRNRVIAA
ncbi:MAG: diguanylate cyclase [Cellvibrionaceae bacterium]